MAAQTNPYSRNREEKFYWNSANPVLRTSVSQVQSKRQRVVREIYDTECSYISQLSTIVNLFLKPVELGSLLPVAVVRAIFSNVEDILTINRQLFSLMRQRSLGEAFSSFAPYLKLYSIYARDYQNSSETLMQSLKRYPDFMQFLSSQTTRVECRGLTLSQLLIIPIQRIPRYKLLLDKLLKYTKTTHSDYDRLQRASDQINDVATHINDQIRRQENSVKMLQIQNCLQGAPPIMAPGRWFVREGRLMKLCRKRGKERMVFLFSDVLMYARPRSRLLNGKRFTYTTIESPSTVGIDGCTVVYVFCCMLPLLTSSVEVVERGRTLKSYDVQGIYGGSISVLVCTVYNPDTSLMFYSLDDHTVWQWAGGDQEIMQLREAYRSLLTSQKLTLPSSPSSSLTPHTLTSSHESISLQTMTYPLTATFTSTDFMATTSAAISPSLATPTQTAEEHLNSEPEQRNGVQEDRGHEEEEEEEGEEEEEEEGRRRRRRRERKRGKEKQKRVKEEERERVRTRESGREQKRVKGGGEGEGEERVTDDGEGRRGEGLNSDNNIIANVTHTRSRYCVIL